jgi:hypothetical protein
MIKQKEISMKALVLIAAAVIFSTAVHGQSPRVFHERLGTPDKVETKDGKVVKETFRYDSKFLVIVTYSDSEKAASLQILPEKSQLLDVRNDPVVKQEELKSALDKIVTADEHGKYVCGTFLNIICLPKNDCGGTRWDYEKVSVYYNSGNGGTRYAILSWRDKPISGNCSTMPKPEPYVFDKVDGCR